MDYHQLPPENDNVRVKLKDRLVFLITCVLIVCFNYWIVSLLFQ
jgi:hypothetical protein